MTPARAGAAALVASAFSTAASGVYLAHHVQRLDPFAFACVSFAALTLVFLPLSALAAPAPAPAVPSLPGLDATRAGLALPSPDAARAGLALPSPDAARAGLALLGLNAATAATFLAYFYALKHIEPAVVSAVEVGLAPAFGLLIAGRAPPGPRRSDLVPAAAAAAGALSLVAAALGRRTGVSPGAPASLLAGLAAAVATSFACVLCVRYTKRLADARWSPTRVLAHRSYAIVPAAALLAPAGSIREVLASWHAVALFAFAGTLVPLYLFQLGVARCREFVVLVSLALVPAFALALQAFDPRVRWSWATLAGVATLVFAVALAAPRAASARAPASAAPSPPPNTPGVRP